MEPIASTGLILGIAAIVVWLMRINQNIKRIADTLKEIKEEE